MIQPSMTVSPKLILAALMADLYIYYKKQKLRYTQMAPKQCGVGAGFVIYHKNKRIHVESIHMPDTSTVFQAEIDAISHACQYAIAIYRSWILNM